MMPPWDTGVPSMTRPPPDIRAITFDLDDTLWEIWPVIARAESRLHEWLEDRYPRIPERFTTLALRALCAEIARQRPDVAHDRTVLRKEALALAARQVGYEEFHVDSAFEVFYQARNEVIFFEEVLPVLERLAGRYVLGALSNGNADIGRVGLGHVFAFSINAIDVGRAKPAPDMFEAAVERLGLPAGQIVHVGDDPELDVVAAVEAGYRAVWVNRAGADWPGGVQADAEVRTLEELEAVLERWSGATA